VARKIYIFLFLLIKCEKNFLYIYKFIHRIVINYSKGLMNKLVILILNKFLLIKNSPILYY